MTVVVPGEAGAAVDRPMETHELTRTRTFVLAVVAALMTFAKQIGFLLVENNRYFFLWRFSDSVGVLLDIGVFAAALYAVSLVARRWRLVEVLWNRILFLLLVSGALTLLPQWLLPPTSLNAYRLGAAAIGAAVVSIVWTRFRLMKYVSAVCLIFAPLLPILALQLVMATTWSADAESAGAAPTPVFRGGEATSGAKTPIFVFVFDEWSLSRSTVNGVVRPEYSRVHEFADGALGFRHAWSYSSRSYHSLPALIYQMDQRIQIGSGVTLWREGDKDVPTSAVPSMFATAKRAGYHTAIQGFYLPYKRILGDQVEYARSFPVFPRGESLLDSMRLSAIRNLQWVVDPVTRSVRRRWEAEIQSHWWYDINHKMLDESLKLVDASTSNTFAVFHWPLPHGPFVLNADGTFKESYPEGGILEGISRKNVTGEAYERHLEYHDVVVGQVLEHMKAAGKFDRALVILTSDHSWRGDPLEPTKNWMIDPVMRRVPLFVKLPNQRQPRMVDKIVYNHLHLGPIVESVIRGQALTEADWMAFIDRMEDVPAPTGKNSVRPVHSAMPTQ
jgi:Sulfatase